MNLGFLASHAGSNLQVILDACRAGSLPATPKVVISNNEASGALLRARRHGLPGYHISAASSGSPELADCAIMDALARHDVDVVVLAGYMKRLGRRVLERYAGAILNIHPSLLPKFGGEGMYGIKVHEAVLASGERETGATVHLVTGDYDTGPILAQTRVPVRKGDTARSLADRVLVAEHLLYSAVIAKIALGELRIPGYVSRAAQFHDRARLPNNP